MMNSQKQNIVMSRYVDKESYPSVSPLLTTLKMQKLQPRAVTVDGHPHVIRAFIDIWPRIIIQRCLYHIQREGMRWLRSYPKTEAGKELRILLNTVTHIRSVKERDLFLMTFDAWQSKYGAFVRSLPRTSVAFKDLKKAVALINNARANMFHYLFDSKIRSTTNLLEGFYSRLKSDFQRHRGLSEQHKISYLNWYSYFENN
jgi:transposase-like protein